MIMIYLLSLIFAALICFFALLWKMSAIAKENTVVRAEFPVGRLKEPLNLFLFQIFTGGQSVQRSSKK